jgi:hypothetical protein
MTAFNTWSLFGRAPLVIEVGLLSEVFSLDRPYSCIKIPARRPGEADLSRV